MAPGDPPLSDLLNWLCAYPKDSPLKQAIGRARAASRTRPGVVNGDVLGPRNAIRYWRLLPLGRGHGRVNRPMAWEEAANDPGGPHTVLLPSRAGYSPGLTPVLRFDSLNVPHLSGKNRGVARAPQGNGGLKCAQFRRMLDRSAFRCARIGKGHPIQIHFRA